MRRYFKLVIEYCINNNLMDMKLAELVDKDIPFRFEFLPLDLTPPSELILYY